MRRDKAEDVVLGLVFEEVFSSETLAYLTKKVSESLARRTTSPDAIRKQRETDLNQARIELKNIQEAIRQGVLTSSTRTMLEEAERRVASLEAGLKPATKAKTPDLTDAVSRHLRDLRATLGRENDRARKSLSALVGPIVLRRHGDRLMAEVSGNLRGLLELEETFGNYGAGRRILRLPPWPRAARTIT